MTDRFECYEPPTPELLTNPIAQMSELYQQDVERAYHLGLLHGINAQSMAQAELDVLRVEDMSWEIQTGVDE